MENSYKMDSNHDAESVTKEKTKKLHINHINSSKSLCDNINI